MMGKVQKPSNSVSTDNNVQKILRNRNIQLYRGIGCLACIFLQHIEHGELLQVKVTGAEDIMAMDPLLGNDRETNN
jgi:hypothetical protein